MMGVNLKGENSILFSTLIIFLYMIISSHAEPETDTLLQGHQLKDGEILVSSGKVFELKFFSSTSNKRKNVGYFGPELLHNRYLGIFYKDSDYKRPVWIANRDNLIPDRSGSLVIDNDGVLKILQDGNTLLILSSVQASKDKTSINVVLWDTGNLVLSEGNFDGSRGRVLWQSFDYPTDTLLPGMRLGFRFGAELEPEHSWKLTSWVSDEVPASGSFTLGADPNGISQLIIWRSGQVYWKSGTWRSPGIFENYHDYTYKFGYMSGNHERFFNLSYVRDWRITSPVFMISELGILRKSDPEDPVNSSFHMTSLVDCHQNFAFGGYSERFVSDGCVSSELPECRSKVSVGIKRGYVVSDGYICKRNQSWSIADCEALCLSSCSCKTFSSKYHNGTACNLWNNLSRIPFNNDGDKEIYVLSDHPLDWKNISPSEHPQGRVVADFKGDLSIRKSLWHRKITRVVFFLIILSLTCICCFKGRGLNANVVRNVFYLLQRKLRVLGQRLTEDETSFVELGSTTSHLARFRRKKHLKILYYKSHGLRLFTYEILFQAADGFSPSTELGKGGFGTVYKGKLQDGQEIALKRLSRSSRQGLMEFKNELKVLAKLQHTNLVKIVGCCVEHGEKIIVYEYMPNKSLDYFLSDRDRKVHLDWKKRFHIIEGITQGLLYLHKYSRLKIIHRDLKAANILLDEDLNAKISDFGMARIFGPEKSQAITHKIAGTFGYMPPEYVNCGNYSEKSDIFSFGVLLMEIVCGKKNNAFYHTDRSLSLIGHAWELWMNDRAFQLIDEDLDCGLCEKKQAMRCIHVSLLCTQEQPTERPSMADVVAMINNKSIQLGPPNRPAFFFEQSLTIKTDLDCDDAERKSFNDVTISDMVAR